MACWTLIIGVCLAITSMRYTSAKVKRSDFDMFFEMAQDLSIDGCDLLMINSPFQGKPDA